MFSFPLKNKEHTENWLKNIKRKGFIPTEYSRLCSKHFLLSDFKPYNKENGRLRLNDNAVPLVFNSSTEEVHCQSIIETYEVEAEGPLDLNMPELCEDIRVSPIQSNLSLKFANKITGVHLNWPSNKMKVKLAVQLLSSSTTKAMQYLKDKNYKQFMDSDETIVFCQTLEY
ncbi:hypothetical protein QTP88_023932 [Uroleucon formosanum]